MEHVLQNPYVNKHGLGDRLNPCLFVIPPAWTNQFQLRKVLQKDDKALPVGASQFPDPEGLRRWTGHQSTVSSFGSSATWHPAKDSVPAKLWPGKKTSGEPSQCVASHFGRCLECILCRIFTIILYKCLYFSGNNLIWFLWLLKSELQGHRMNPIKNPSVTDFDHFLEVDEK